jgi:hypothetical protein
MIIKIKSRKKPTFKQLLKYMIDGQGRILNTTKQSFILTHNLKGSSIEQWDSQFKENEMFRLRKRKDSVILTHEILSWHKEDTPHLTVEKMKDVAREYMRLRNSTGMYVAVPHFDKNHFHIHICASGIQYRTGKSMRLSRAELQNLKKSVQQYQLEKYPELRNSIVRHGSKEKNAVTDREYHFKRKAGRETDKDYITGILKTCYKKADSISRFLSMVEESGLKTYQRSGKTTGVLYKNQKFRFSRLSFNEEQLNYLDRNIHRNEVMEKMRSRKVIDRRVNRRRTI